MSEKSLRERLEQYPYIDSKIKSLEHDIQDAYSGKRTIAGAVQASSREPPYQMREQLIYGFDDREVLSEYIRGIRIEIAQWRAEKAQLNKIVSGIPDTKTQLVIKLKYLDGEKWKDVAAKMGHTVSEESAKKVAQKFFKNFPEIPEIPEAG